MSYNVETKRYFVPEGYPQAINAAGGLPLLLMPLSKDLIAYYLDMIDGLLLSGGTDLDPFYYNEEPQGVGKISPQRDEIEILLTREAIKRKIPILAICRGLQVLAVAAGGTINQDISCMENVLKHSQLAPRWYGTHNVEIEEGTLLHKITHRKRIRVNSFHHQAIDKIPPGYIVSAKTVDGIIEGLEIDNRSDILGVQWHPECMWMNDNEAFSLFRWLVYEAATSDKQNSKR